MAKLTTHVLDIIHGRPAAGMKVEFLKSGLLGKDDAETAASLEKK